MNAGGGLLVGCVISYADAVTKDVAIGASIGEASGNLFPDITKNCRRVPSCDPLFFGPFLCYLFAVLSSVASTQLFGFEISGSFVVGVCMVIYAVFLYGERATCCGIISKQ